MLKSSVRKTVCTIVGGAALLSTPFTADAQESYFYSGGTKHPLKQSEKWVAAPLEDAATAATLTPQPGFDSSKRVQKLNRQVAIAAVKPGATAQQRKELRAALAGRNASRKLLNAFEDAKGNPLFETGEVLVQFRPEVSAEQAADLAAKQGATIVRPIGKFVPNGYVLQPGESRTATEVANALFEQGVAIFSHPDLIASGQLHYVPNDPRYQDQWYLNNAGGIFPARKAGADIKAPRAWELSRGSSGIIVAVFDCGFDLSHEEFPGEKVVSQHDYFNSDTDASPGTYDHHGTPCAGLIAATADNGKGISGVAPLCRLILAKVGEIQSPNSPTPNAMLFGSQTTAQAFVDAADAGAAVISCSWEAPLFDVEKAAIQYAANQGRGGRGCVIFFSSGNDSATITNEFAKLPEVIAVGASTDQDVRAAYSNYGPELDLVAPSSTDGSLNVLATDRRGSAGYESGDYANFGGTSAACPIAAGVGALVLSREPSLTRQQVYQRLTGTADKIDTAHVTSDANGWNQYYGYGRVNALRALAASDTTPPSLTISTPDDGFTSREMPEAISGYAYDSGSLLEPSVDLVIYQDGKYWNGTSWTDRPAGAPVPLVFPKPQVDSSGLWACTNLPSGPDLRSGVYYVNASVYDAAGNASLPVPGTNSLSFRIDRSPPTVSIAAPLSGTVLTHAPAGVWFKGAASDAESTEHPQVALYIQRVSDGYYWGGGSWIQGESFGSLGTKFLNGTSNWECTSPLPGVGPDTVYCMAAGDYQFIVVARDAAGNESRTQVQITVDYTLTLPNLSVLTEQPQPLIGADTVASQDALAYTPLPATDERNSQPLVLRKDASGNLITGIAMWLYRDPASYPSSALVKHSPSGQQLWRLERQTEKITTESQGLEVSHYYERFAPDQPWSEISDYDFSAMYALNSVEVDAAGNTYAAFQYWTIQYRQYATSSSGTPLWANLPTGAGTIAVAKFNPSGQLLWKHNIGASASDQSWYPVSSAIALRPLSDGSAAVLVQNWQYYDSGFGLSFSVDQMVLSRVGAATGGFRKHFGYGAGFSIPLHLQADAADNLYVTSNDGPLVGGYSYTIPAPDHLIRKFSPAGDLLREVRIDHCDQPETWNDVTINPATGELYVAANHSISYENNGRQVALKFDLSRPAGQELVWRSFGPAYSADPYSSAKIALTPAGIYVANTARNNAYSSTERARSVVSRFALDGTHLWTRNYLSPSKPNDTTGDTVEAMRADAAGNVYLLGYTADETGLTVVALRKISLYGDVQFAKVLPGNAYFQSSHPSLLLLPGEAAPTSLAFALGSPAPGRIITIANPGNVIPPITVPDGEPADQTAPVGSTVTFTVHAGGSAPLVYQWRKHTAAGIQPIPGANGPTLTLANVQPSDEAGYSVVVSNSVATAVTSRVASLQVEVLAPLVDALDAADLTWTTGGDQPWHGQIRTSYDGTDAAVSGPIGDNGTSWLETTVTGPGVLSFRWKVSSESGYDRLTLLIDGTEVTSISGEQDWLAYQAFLAEGSHTVRWSYSKDGSQSGGADRAWLDVVHFAPGQPARPQITQQPRSLSIALGHLASFSVTATGDGILSYQWLKDSEEIPFATDATYTIGSVSQGSVGKYQVRVTGLGGTVLSDEVALAISSDRTLPTLKITSPAANLSVQTSTIQVTGTASDNQGVKGVYLYVEGPGSAVAFYTAQGTTSWTADITVAPGVNDIYAYCEDEAGNYSNGVHRTVTYSVPAVLTVATDGPGAVYEAFGSKLKPVAPTSNRLTGKPFTLVAKPGKGYLCLGWSFGTDPTIVVPGSTLSTSLTSDAAVTAHFVPTPFPTLAGTYSGIIEGDPASVASSGGFTVTVSSGGMLTGKLNFGGKAYSLKLALDASASGSKTFKQTVGAGLTFTLGLTDTGVTGGVSVGNLSLATFTGARVLPYSKKAAAPQEGRYTMLLDDPDGTGVGNALVQVGADGKVTLLGSLTHGDIFSMKTVLCSGNRAPVYAKLPGTMQALVGWLEFSETPGVSDLAGTLVRFANTQLDGIPLTISGSAVHAAAGGYLLPGLEPVQGAAKLTFSGGGLAAPFTQTVTFAPNVSKKGAFSAKVTFPASNPQAVKLTVNPLTGAFVGSFKQPGTGNAVLFLGVLYQKQDLGEGRFEIGDQVGTVTLEPATSGQ